MCSYMIGIKKLVLKKVLKKVLKVIPFILKFKTSDAQNFLDY